MAQRTSPAFFLTSIFFFFFLLMGCNSKPKQESAEIPIDKPDTIEALIQGKGVNVRAGPGIKHSVKFQLEDGARVLILREAYSASDENKPVELILTAPLTLHADGEKVTLAKGTIVTSASAGDPGGDLLIITFELEGKRCVDSSVYIENIKAKPISEKPWYRIQTRDGRQGWVYSEFVVEL